MFVSCALQLSSSECVCTLYNGGATDFALLLAALADRDPVALSPTLREPFLSVAWLMEYLRAARIPRLVLSLQDAAVGAAPPRSAVLDLRSLIDMPKQVKRHVGHGCRVFLY